MNRKYSSHDPHVSGTKNQRHHAERDCPHDLEDRVNLSRDVGHVVVQLLVDELQLPFNPDDVLTVLCHFFPFHYTKLISPPRLLKVRCIYDIKSSSLQSLNSSRCLKLFIIKGILSFHLVLASVQPGLVFVLQY